MKKFFILLAGVMIEFSALAQNTNSILGQYIYVKNALVIGNGKEASSQIAALYNMVKEVANFPQKAV